MSLLLPATTPLASPPVEGLTPLLSRRPQTRLVDSPNAPAGVARKPLAPFGLSPKTKLNPEAVLTHRPNCKETCIPGRI
jgi:hypothetical protein